jgi:hypothetical protein
MESSITCPAPDIPAMTLHPVPNSPIGYGAAMPSNASIEYFPAPVMHISKKPPMMLRSL